MGTATATATSTLVFTKEELDALRQALSKGRNAVGDHRSPPEERPDPENDWSNDVFLLIKFLKDLNTILSTVIQKRIPVPQRKGFEIALQQVQGSVDTAIQELSAIDGPENTLFKKLREVGLTAESLLVKLDEFRDRIGNGPILAILKLGNSLLGSLCKALLLEPLKEVKEIVETRIEYGADDEILQLHLNR